MTREQPPTFELPKKLEKIIASLATYYGRNNRPELQRVLVNSSYRVQEEYSYDGWNGGTYGHAVYFHVPAAIYFQVFDNLDGVCEEVCKDISRISNVQNEFIERVFLELQDDPTLENWRERSDVLLHPTPISVIASQDQLDRIWKPGYLRLFTCHKDSNKRQAASFKAWMERYGVSCFVAHEDIKPTKEWQNEIEKALFSMEAMVALMTEDFSDSDWTDQEIGVAIGRQVAIISVRLGKDPYGFIGKFQGLSGDKKDGAKLAKEVYELLWQNLALKSRLTETLVKRFETAGSYSQANELVQFLGNVEHLSPTFIERLEVAVNSNNQVAGAFKVKEILPGLLQRLRGNVD